jgi:hypothetical protein
VVSGRRKNNQKNEIIPCWMAKDRIKMEEEKDFQYELSFESPDATRR